MSESAEGVVLNMAIDAVMQKSGSAEREIYDEILDKLSDFYPGELRTLSAACSLLSRACREAKPL